MKSVFCRASGLVAYLLHLTIRLAGMVNKAPIASHSVPINYQPAVQMEAVMVGIVHVNAVHSFFELLIGNHFANVLENEVPLIDWFFGANTPTCNNPSIGIGIVFRKLAFRIFPVAKCGKYN